MQSPTTHSIGTTRPIYVPVSVTSGFSRWSLRWLRAVPSARLFGGMIAAAVIGIFLIPLLFIVAERLRVRTSSAIAGARVRKI